MLREDFIIRLVKQLGDFLARIAGNRRKENYDGAIAEADRAWDELLGVPRNLVEVVDTPTLAELLRDPAKMRAAAQLLIEEGRAYAGKRDPVHAAVCYRRAFELYLEVRARDPDPNDDAAIIELARSVPANQLDPRYRG